MQHDSPPPCSPDAAFEFAVHHLQLAHLFWLSSPSDHEQNMAELARIAKKDAAAYFPAFEAFFNTCQDVDRMLAEHD